MKRWLRIGTLAAFVGAASALAAAVAGGITEPTGIATVVAVAATVIAYGLAPLAITLAMRQSALSSWWAVAAALLTVLLLARYDGNLPIPGLTHSMQRAVLYVALFGSWMAALSIPWGIPFWWPPERESPAESNP